MGEPAPHADKIPALGESPGRALGPYRAAHTHLAGLGDRLTLSRKEIDIWPRAARRLHMPRGSAEQVVQAERGTDPHRLGRNHTVRTPHARWQTHWLLMVEPADRIRLPVEEWIRRAIRWACRSRRRLLQLVAVDRVGPGADCVR